MSISLVEANKNWRFLLRSITELKDYRYLGSFPSRFLIGALLAPVAIAKFLNHFSPELLKKKHLNILVAGAELSDALDEGRWYQMIPALVGESFTLDVILVGKEYDPRRARSPFIDRIADRFKPAKGYSGFVQDVPGIDLSLFDLIVMFHPGLEVSGDDHWVESGILSRFVASGKPIMVTAYHYDEYLFELGILQANGYSPSGGPLINTFYGADDSMPMAEMTKWGHIIWRLSNVLPPEGFIVDKQLMEDIDLVSRLGGMAYVNGVKFPDDICVRMSLRGSDGEDAVYIKISNQHYANTRTGRLGLYEHAGKAVELLPVGMSLATDELVTAPGAAEQKLKRLIWASKVIDQRFEFDLPEELEGMKDLSV